jgi:diguanylate cyclase (GGDEF)-like protein/PAS domain S-box-containing protein
VAAQRLLLVPDGLSLFGKSVDTHDEFIALMHPDDAFSFKKKASRFFVADPSAPHPDEPDGVEFRIQSLHGDWKWYVIRRSRVGCSSGKVTRVMGSMMDIDAFKRAVEAMRSSETRLETIFKSAPGSMAVTDAEGKVMEANQAFYDMLGYSARDVQGVFIMSLSTVKYGKEGGELMAEILTECERSEDKRFRREEDFVRSDGERITVDYGLSAIFDFDGNVSNYIFSGVDITLQIKHTETLNLLAENQRWLFSFLRQVNQFDGADKLFHALKENLPHVVSFSSLRLLVPSFLDKPWIFDDRQGASDENSVRELDELLAGTGPLGTAYVSRSTVNYINVDSPDGVQSILAIPLVYKEKTWGVLALESDSYGAFSNEDVTLMNILGGNIGLYFEEQSSRSELDVYTQQLHQLHIFIRSLLATQNREHLLEGMLGYLKSVMPNSACAVYLFKDDSNGGATTMERLAWYDDDDTPVPDNALALESAHSQTPRVEYNEMGLESRHVSPIIFQSRTVGAVDVYKPLGIQSKELKMYQLLVDYASSFWALYDLMAMREEEASVDSLTGIWNRRYMIHRFQEEADRISRYDGNACVVIGDMGNFKQINDNYGHSKGDEVLIKVAGTLRRCLRVSDSVGRYGGDEFLMLLPNITKSDANIVLGRIKTELGLLRIKSSDEGDSDSVLDVILDFGLAVYPGDAPTLLDTINLADEDMYANKIARKKKSEIPITREGAEKE